MFGAYLFTLDHTLSAVGLFTRSSSPLGGIVDTGSGARADVGWKPYGGLVKEVRVRPGPGVPSGLVIPPKELTERYSHASGPGGQGVNTADSRVQLSFDVAASTVLTDAQRTRVLERLSTRLDGTVITVIAAEHRSQRRNRAAARERLAALLSDALAPPPRRRRATRPSRGAVNRRLAAKRHRADALRRRRTDIGD